MRVTIFHNPACGTSRSTLAMIRHAGIEPEVIEYLETPPTEDQLRELVRIWSTGTASAKGAPKHYRRAST